MLVVFALLFLSQDRLVFGVKGGVTMSPVYDLGSSCRLCGSSEMNLNRFSGGPFAEVLLLRRLGLRVEAGAMYRRGRMDWRGGPAPDAIYWQTGVRAKVWEFPLLLKRRISVRKLQTFGSVGASLRRAGPFTQDRLTVPFLPNLSRSSRTIFTTPADPLRTGVTVGGGVRLRLYRRLYLEPEFRYTHWTSKYFLPTTEHFDFVLGTSFGR